MNPTRAPLVVLVLFATLSIVYSSSLTAFKTCPSLLSYMVRNSVKRVGPWGLLPPSGCFFGRKSGVIAFASDASGPVEAVSSAPVEGVDFSGTNVQVSGVDEPDIVKTDGDRVFTLSRGRFFYVKVTNSGMDGEVLANISIASYPREMLFDPKSDSIVIISQEYENLKPLKSPLTSRPIYPYYGSRPIIVLYRVSVKDDRDVKITEKAYIPGTYKSARSVGGVARLVLSYDASYHIPFVSPGGKLFQQDATKLNIELLKKTTLSNWVPFYNASGTYCDGKICRKYSVRKPISECASIFFPKDQFSGFSLLTVATFNLKGYFVIKGSSIIADGRTVYATEKSVYAATTEYQYDVDEFDVNIGRRFRTSFHKFDLGSSGIKYIASGEVQGSVLNQFSMHEYKDTFFVATTEGAWWWGSRDQRVSKVSSFRVSSNKLVKVGEVGGLGKGERIYGVRYVADVAYVVTFRRIDPLYVVDLSDAYNLKVTGELKIPGYSAYLHPIGPGRVLGVGRDTNPQGILTGAKVSLFDVSDVKSPKQLATWSLKGSYTRATWDHRAFLWWGPEKVAVLPLSIYYREAKKWFTGSIVLSVFDTSITERGRVSPECCGPSYYSKSIRRNFVISKTNLWSFSTNALQVNGIKDLKTKSTVPLFTYFPKRVIPSKPILVD